MIRPKRAPLRRRLTELYVRKLSLRPSHSLFGTPFSAA